MNILAYNNVLQSLRSADGWLEQKDSVGMRYRYSEVELLQFLFSGMLRTRAIHLKPLIYTPFMVDTEAGQPGNGVPLLQLF